MNESYTYLKVNHTLTFGVQSIHESLPFGGT